jgi:hypothetical protein
MPSNSNHIIAMTCDLELIQAAEGEATGPKKFAVKVYNGGALQVSRWDYPVVIDLAGMKVATSVVANLDHVQSQRVGHVTNVTNDGKRVNLDGVFSAATPHRDEVIESAADGFPWQASVEVMPTQAPDFIGDGEKIEVNGQKFTGPIQVARKSELYGFGFVSRGADSNTSVKIAAEAASSKGRSKMKPELKQWIEAQGFDAENVTDVQAAQYERLMTIEAAAAKPQAPAPLPGIKAGAGNDGAALMGDDHWDVATIVAAHQDNLEAIEVVLAKHEDDVSDRSKLREIRATARASIVGLKKKAIDEKWSAEKYELESVKATNKVELELVHAARPVGPAIHQSTRDMTPAVIEAALAQTVGMANIEKHYDEKTLEAAHKQFRGRVGLKQLLILAAAQNGMSCGPGYAIHAGNLREVLRYAVPNIEASFSTLSLPGIFSNVANKEILEGYMEEDQSWREIAQIRNVSDFKAVTSYRLLDDMEYEQLAGDGRIKHGKLGEESYTRQADTYAKMFSITRKDIINDDLGALDSLRTRLGMGAAKKFNKLFWTEFLDNSTFFTSARTNYIEGATTNLGTDGVGLSLGVKAFRQMKSPAADGNKKLAADTVGGRPEILIVPPELEAAAEILYRNTNLGQVSGATANIHANKYRPVVVPWLSDSAYTGYSATAWYLFRAPRGMAPIVVSFLNGVQTPTVESAEADFDQLGIQFRGYHDFGADKAEYLSGIKSKGAA